MVIVNFSLVKNKDLKKVTYLNVSLNMTDYILPLSMTGIWQTIAVIRGCSFGRQLRSSGAAVLTDNCGHPGLRFWQTTAVIRGLRFWQTTAVIRGLQFWHTTAVIRGCSFGRQQLASGVRGFSRQLRSSGSRILQTTAINQGGQFGRQLPSSWLHIQQTTVVVRFTISTSYTANVLKKMQM